ncbi:hypothetical protein VTP01DRAFT_7512 [Rhizomucor pusillus]|uniref:uncharacterized protein n=1 Tax=Rhizomucor pusillus TaxID=4840 RepID=UPI0037445E8F
MRLQQSRCWVIIEIIFSYRYSYNLEQKLILIADFIHRPILTSGSFSPTMPNLKTTTLEPRQKWRSCMRQRQFTHHKSSCRYVSLSRISTNLPNLNLELRWPVQNQVSHKPGISMVDAKPGLGETRESVSVQCTIQSILLNTYKIALEIEACLYKPLDRIMHAASLLSGVFPWALSLYKSPKDMVASAFSKLPAKIVSIFYVKLHQHSEYQQQILGRAFLSSIHADFLTRHCHFNKRNGCIFHQGDQGDRKGRLNSVMASYCICTDDMNKPLKLPNCSGVDVLKHLSNLERCSLEYRITGGLSICTHAWKLGGHDVISCVLDPILRPLFSSGSCRLRCERKCRMRRVERPDAILSDIQGLSFGRSRVFGEVKSKAADERSKAMNFCA